ncbi:hypothetical protein SBA3_750008 [Candidatus Sulfopaludibacter sp. SbA3]|nr:hypothetical protein SBA3_750008 [Candidatus Sulfopaludibacter sp. SbA3]
MLGVRCYAAPILNQQREPVAAISVSGPTARLTDENAAQMVIAIRAAAQDVANRLQPQVPACQTSVSF